MATKQIFSILILLVSVPCFANPTDTSAQDRKALTQVDNEISSSALKIIRQIQAATEQTIERRSVQGPGLNSIHEVFKVSKKNLKINDVKILTSADATSDLNLIASRVDVKRLRTSGVWISSAGNLLALVYERSHFEEDFIGAVVDPRQAFAEILSNSQLVDSSGNVIAGTSLSPFLNGEVKDFFRIKREGAQGVRNSGVSRGMVWQLGNLPFAFVTERSIHPFASVSNDHALPKALAAALLVVICASILYWSDKQEQDSIGNAIDRLVQAQSEIQLEKNWILDSRKEIITGETNPSRESDEIQPTPYYDELSDRGERSPDRLN
jgi:hypothetical protein